VKPAVLIAVLVSQFLLMTPWSLAIGDHDLQVLYGELKAVESESLRVAITIEILEERLFDAALPENPEDLFQQLESLYKHYAKLEADLGELIDQWNQMVTTVDAASVMFTPDQLKPIPIISRKYLAGLPEESIPLSGFLPALVE